MRSPAVLSRLNHRASTRVMLPVGAVISLAIVLVCGGVVLDARHHASQGAEQAANNIAATTAQSIARIIDLYDQSLQIIAHNLTLPVVASLDPAERQSVLFDGPASMPYLGFINVLDAAGEVRADSRSLVPRSGNFAGRDYFQFHRRDPHDALYVGRPFLTAPDQPASLPLSRRLRRSDGSFAGVAVAALRLAVFHDLFARVALGSHGTIALLREDGLILMRLPFNQDDLGRSLPASSPFFEQAVSGAAHVHGKEPGDPVVRGYTFRRVEALPLVVAVAMADEDVYGPWRREATVIMSAVAALWLLLLTGLVHLGAAARRQQRADTRALAATDEMKHFVATISHELRTPLTSILGYAELLSMEQDFPAGQIGFVAAISSAAEHMGHVIRRMVEPPLWTTVADPPVREDTNLDRLMAECIAGVRLDANAKGLDLRGHVAPDLPHSAMLDPAQVRQILLNLLRNAVKYTKEGSVSLRVSRGEQGLRFEVADTGPGVPAAQRARLFMPYDRLGAEQGPIEGKGLGLSIAWKLVTGLDGTIGHTDNPAGGSIFWVELPVVANAAPCLPEPPRPDPAPEPPRPLWILLADDTALTRELTIHFLQSAGHTVIAVEDGLEAVNQAANADFDVVLMDVRMPRMDGLEAARRIRSLGGPRSRVPIVALTADIAGSSLEACRRAGINHRQPKPFTCDALLQVVNAAVGSPEPLADPDPPGTIAKRPLPLLDAKALDALTARMSNDNVDAYLRSLSRRLDELIRLLRSTAPDDRAALVDMVHEMQGTAGLLGFAALAAMLHRHEAATTAGENDAALTAQLLTVAERSQTVLAKRLASGIDAVPPS